MCKALWLIFISIKEERQWQRERKSRERRISSRGRSITNLEAKVHEQSTKKWKNGGVCKRPYQNEEIKRNGPECKAFEF